MAYLTSYTLEIFGASDSELNQIELMLEDEGVLGYALERDGSSTYCCCDCVTWYDHDTVLLGIAKRFPNARFTLHGEGEMNDDIWETHYQGEKLYTQGAIITIPPFDPILLREP